MFTAIQKVINDFGRLPGVGEKTAERFAYFLLRAPKEEALKMSEDLQVMATSVLTCKKCFNKTDKDPCEICSNSSRDHQQLCIVENPIDILVIEKLGIYKGLYFVLGGVIDPANGVGPDELLFSELVVRVSELIKEHNALEIIFALSPSLQGDATMNYTKKELNDRGAGIHFSRLAQGLMSGADIQFADKNTLSKAFSGRIDV